MPDNLRVRAVNAVAEVCAERASEPDAGVRGDRSSLSCLYRNHSRELAAYLRKTYGDGPPDPEDIVQQAFLKLSERDGLSEIRNLRAFLWRTARNLLLTHKRNELLFFAIQGNDCSPERVLDIEQQLSAINDALREMPERRRNAFIWHRVEGLNVAAVARRFGVTRAAAVKHIARAALDIDTALDKTLKQDD